MRTKNILGFNKMLETIKNWQPNYDSIVCALKTALIKLTLSQNKLPHFFTKKTLAFLRLPHISL
jgi:hypothetical protein